MTNYGYILPTQVEDWLQSVQTKHLLYLLTSCNCNHPMLIMWIIV